MSGPVCKSHFDLFSVCFFKILFTLDCWDHISSNKENKPKSKRSIGDRAFVEGPRTEMLEK